MNRHMRTFYTLVLTQTFSQIGSRISSLALSIWIFAQTGNATPLALVAFFLTIPSVFASTISGVLADRWDRRLVIVLADTGQAAGTLLLLLLFLAGDLQLWHLYLVTLIQAIFGVFQRPAFKASITMLVDEKHRDRANAIQQITGPAAGLITPVIAGSLYTLVGLTGTILIDLFTFVIAIIVIYLIRIPRPRSTAEGRAASGSVWQEALAGLRFLWQRRTLFFLECHMALVNFLLGGAGALVLAYLLARTENKVILGVLLGVMNLGAVVGGLVMGAWGGTRPRIHTVMPGIIFIGVFMALIGIAQTSWLIGLVLFGLMIPVTLANAAYTSIIQAKVPPDMQGRVFALLEQISLLLLPIAQLGVGPLADNVFEPAVGQPGWEMVAPLVGNHFGSGMALIMVIAGSIAAVTSLLVYALPAVRHLEANLPDYEAVAADEAQPVSEGDAPVNPAP